MASRERLASTQWLANGLRVVRLKSESQPDLVSLRIVVEGGPEGMGKGRQYLPHLVEHLAFHAPDSTEATLSWLRDQSCQVAAYTMSNYVVHEFELPATKAEIVLRRLRSQWDAPGFDSVVFEREVRRLEHELSSFGDPMIFRAAHALAPGSPMDHLAESELAELDSATAEVAWDFFRATYVGARTSLIVAAAPDVLAGLGNDLQSFGDLQAGHPWAGSRRSEHIGWLQGALELPDDHWASGFGLWFEVPGWLQPSHRLLLEDAVEEFLQEDLALRQGLVYDIDFNAQSTSNSEIWTFDGRYSPQLTSRAEFQQAIVEALQRFQSEANSGWWEARLASWAATTQQTRLDPVTLADETVRYLAILPHGSAVPPGLGWPQPRPTEAIQIAAGVLKTAKTFSFMPGRFVRDWSELEADGIEWPVLVSYAWFVDDLVSTWEGIAFLLVFMGAVQYITYLVVRDTVRWLRGHRGGLTIRLRKRSQAA